MLVSYFKHPKEIELNCSACRPHGGAPGRDGSLRSRRRPEEGRGPEAGRPAQGESSALRIFSIHSRPMGRLSAGQ